jgi:hypothetical protein
LQGCCCAASDTRCSSSRTCGNCSR